MNRRQLLTLSGLSVVALASGLRPVLGAGRPRFPDVDGAEVREVRIRITDSEGDRQPALAPQRQHRFHRRIQPEPLIELDDFCGRNGKSRTQPPVGRIAIGNDRVEAVVAAVELDQHEDPVRPASDEYLNDGWIAQLFGETSLGRDYDADGVILDRNDAGPLFGGGLGTVALGRAEKALARAARMRGIEAETANPALAHVLSVRDQLRQSARAILEKRVDAVDLGVSFPGDDFGRQMETAARLIAAGVETPVIKVSIGSFDTHANQPGTHDRLLASLAGGIAAFARVAEDRGFWERVLVMTYSEFGRRPAENGSRGTDHDTAAPHFLVGGRVRGGFYGEQPPLNRLEDGNLGHRLHFRSLYATAARDWWGLPASFIAEPPLGCIS